MKILLREYYNQLMQTKIYDILYLFCRASVRIVKICALRQSLFAQLCRNFIISFFHSPLSGHFQFLVPLLENLFFSSFELIPGRNVSDGTVKPVLVVMVNVLINQLSYLLKREWGAWSRTHSLFSVLCQRSSLPLLCG